MINHVYAVEVSGVCNLESTCTWCPMHNRPRSRKRGLMTDETVEHALRWVKASPPGDVLFLHVFGEPFLHPKFLPIAQRFSEVCPISVSSNGVLITERLADEIAKIPWAWVTLSPWDIAAKVRATRLLHARGVFVKLAPPPAHDWAGQSETGKSRIQINGCQYLNDDQCVIRWDGSLATCCISDRMGDEIGHVSQDPREVSNRSYDLCATCHHRL